MKFLKSFSRIVIFPILIFFRFDRLILKKSKKKCCIINFHGVRNQENNPFNNRHMLSKDFEKIISYLSKNFNIVPLETLFEYHQKKQILPKKTIALTFDDGYENNFSIALPILKKYNVPATFYIISKGLLDNSFFSWPDKMDILKKNIQTDFTINNHIFPFPTYYNHELKINLIDFLKLQGDGINSIVDELITSTLDIKKTLFESKELFELIREQEFKQFINEPLIEFGSHTHSHPNLEFLDRLSAEKELKESKELLEKLTEKKVKSLAFPDGSYSNETIDIALNLGYHNLVAVEYKFQENNKNPNLLSRFTISNSTTFESNMIRLAKHFDKYGSN